MSQTTPKGSLIRLRIDDLAYGGRGVAREGDFVWFVTRGIPGQTVLAKVFRKKKAYGEAVVADVLERSPDQVKPPCPYFGVCGGCQLQHLAYEAQIRYKEMQVKDLLQRIGGLPSPPVLPIIPAEVLYGYRNKMEFTFSDQPWRTGSSSETEAEPWALGLHIPGRYDRVLDIERCRLLSETGNRVFKKFRTLARKTGLPPYNLRTHEGFWRFLVIREAPSTGNLLIHAITAILDESYAGPILDTLARRLAEDHAQLTSFVHGTSDRPAQAAFAEKERIVLGPGKILERVGSKQFEISAGAFFQTNSFQAERLFETVADLAGLEGRETVLDLYCGTGAIGIYLANRAKTVIGIEVIESAIDDARRNAEINQAGNVKFILADMKDALTKHFEEIRASGDTPDVVILDPPRGGTHPRTIEDLLSLAPDRIVYVSCNPPLLARDLAVLCKDAYVLDKVRPVDMFPQTGHIEVVARLVKKR